MKIAVLGAGAWGTALAINLLKNSNSRHEIILWTKDSGHCAELLQEHTNRQFLPGFPLPESLQLTSDLKIAVKADLVLIVVPIAGLRDTLRAIVSCGKAIPVIWGVRDLKLNQLNYHIRSYLRNMKALLLMVYCQDLVLLKRLLRDYRQL